MSSISAANLFGVKGLVAVITGGGSGIGLMMAKALEDNGAKVYIIGRRLTTLKASAKEAKHGNIIPLQGDVTSKEDLTRVVDHITKVEGFINVLIANAGAQGPLYGSLPPNPTLAQLHSALWSSDAESFTNTFNINVTAIFFSVVAFLPLLDAGNSKGNVEQKSQVIATSSLASFERLIMAGFSYCASKAGTNHIMKQFSTLLTPYGIRSNVIAPGLFPSELADKAIAHLIKTGGGEMPGSVVPMKRAGSLEDMAGAILFLTSKAGGYLSGNVLITDGGRLGSIPATY